MKRSSLFLLSTLSAFGQEPIEMLDPIVVTGKAEDLLGEVTSANEGRANNEELSKRPTVRRGELLEVIPGVIVTQHAGGGKANQYFVRGYNLDHGTDFHVGLDGMPANYRTHSHGQGYADINFIVPEFVDHLSYFKGPFNTSYGDLSTAGGAEYELYNRLPEGILSLTYGSDDYARFLFGDSWDLGAGALTFGIEYTHENGPWLQKNDYNRYNLFARYHQGDEDNYFNITGLAHTGKWNSSDQIPLRAVQDGSLDRFGSLDDSTGGDTSRYSLSTRWQRSDENSTTHLDAWLGTYDLELFSNFTYFLNDPVRGDQFEQNESRIFAGANLWHQWNYQLSGMESKTTLGFQTRHDFINDIGLYLTQDRERYRTIRQDDVNVSSYSLYLDHETRINDWFRAGLGLRSDLFQFDVESDLAANSGNETDSIFSPKLNFAFGPWNETEFYLNAGLGFHSNDARGTTLAIDPTDGVSPLDRVDPLVRTQGAEFGIRSHALNDVTATLAFWYLESDSELVYIGDAGTSEAGDASERWGIETAIYWRPHDWLTADLEYAFSDARFVGAPSGFDHIPNSVEHSVSAGLTLGNDLGWFGSLRARYFAPRPLEESGRIQSDSSFLVNGRIGYRKEDWEVSLDVLNIFDERDNDIEYYYESRLPGEAGGVTDTHFHPTEPRQVRLNVSYHF
ncbi:TonB-dependent receptor plug domain-containing protein [Verrucomicrobiaceae bacterium 227]